MKGGRTQAPVVNRRTHPRRLFGAVVRVDAELARLGSLPELNLQSITPGQEVGQENSGASRYETQEKRERETACGRGRGRVKGRVNPFALYCKNNPSPIPST